MLKLFILGLSVAAVLRFASCGKNPKDEEDESAHVVAWGYTEAEGLTPPQWGQNYTNCNGKRQSPIDINSKKAQYDENLKPLVLENYDKVDTRIKYHVSNNGHTVFVALDLLGDLEKNPITLTFKDELYRMHSLHPHWGHYPQIGSEHTVDKRQYPFEFHIIHWKDKYGNFSEALKHSDGLLVWGQFYDVEEDTPDNTDLNVVLDHINDIQMPDRPKDIATFKLDKFIPDGPHDSYYHYHGSLTTPGCHEVVWWVVNQKVQTISKAQLAKFRTIFTHNDTMYGGHHPKILDNFRPVQNLNNRIVYTSKKNPGSGAMAIVAGVVSVLLPIVALLL